MKCKKTLAVFRTPPSKNTCIEVRKGMGYHVNAKNRLHGTSTFSRDFNVSLYTLIHAVRLTVYCMYVIIFIIQVMSRYLQYLPETVRAT